MIAPKRLDPRGGANIDGYSAAVLQDPMGPMGDQWLWIVWTNPWGIEPAKLLKYSWTSTRRSANLRVREFIDYRISRR